jgi:heat shock 70kDa protein 1/2/6/8
VIFDLGGGTFDVSVLKITEGSAFDVLAVAGDTNLGGVDFDNLLVEYCITEFKSNQNIDLTNNKRAIRRLQQACESAKITLSQSEEADIVIECIQDGLDFNVKIERSDFEHMCRQLLNKTLDCVRSALADAKLKPAEIDEILLIGGSTRIPKIVELLKNLFVGKSLNSAVHPDEAVAHGAAFQAAILSGGLCNSFGQLNDVTPLSLGISTAIDNKLNVIIHRNTKVPHKNTHRYQTLKDFQSSASISVYEGERPFVVDNVLLSEFFLNNLTVAKRGVTKVDVQFDIDANGILIVTATEVGNSNTASIRIANVSGRLSKDSIEKMMRDAEKYRQFDEERAFSIALRNQMRNYIDNCLTDAEKMEDSDVIKEVTNDCDMESKWLKNNPQASKSEVQDRFDRLRTVMKAKLKPINKSIKLLQICKTLQAVLQNEGGITAALKVVKVEPEIIEID